MPAKRRRDAGRARGGEPIVDAILEHTLADLARAGIDGLSIDRIARAAAVNKTTIYRRWPTREGLVADCCTQSPRELANPLNALAFRRKLPGLFSFSRVSRVDAVDAR